MQRYLKRFLTVGIAVLALVAMVGLQAKVVWATPELLLIQDNNPFSTDADPNNPVIDAAEYLGKTHDIITSSDLETMSAENLGKYKIIVLAEGQNTNYYHTIDNEADKIEDAVYGGSVLLAHLASNAVNGYTFLPDLVSTSYAGYDANTVDVLDSACVVTGLNAAALQNWNRNAHVDDTAYGIFTNLGLISGQDPVVIQSVGNSGAGYSGPCYIQYSHGDGYVMATTMPIEAAALYYVNQSTTPDSALPQFLRKEISCAQGKIPPEPDVVIELLEDIQLRLIAIEAKLDNHDCPNCPTCPLCPECPLPNPTEPILPWWRPGSEAEPPWSSILPLRNR